jgi:hypothetical protein
MKFSFPFSSHYLIVITLLILLAFAAFIQLIQMAIKTNDTVRATFFCRLFGFSLETVKSSPKIPPAT